ncbi:23S rRNA m(2)G2445 and m(7)G2069 methyltransferases [Gammaproteobacteria bacterium]|nr:23S rRNA m(2)G2445 and m(7)G2069 methyltransferases [Gammaproteobacteria bacterium]
MVDELKPFGIEGKMSATGVSFEGEIKDAYQACLWSRCASKVFLVLKSGKFKDLDKLHFELQSFPWSAHLGLEQTFLISVTATKNPHLNTHFAALRVKDAVVDYFQELMEDRPNVAKEDPDLRFHVHISEHEYTLYLDLSGISLHKRGFRLDAGIAPIKENLAAALLYKSGWPEKARQQQHFLDPLCGAGTILIEAALMARDIAPGLFRQYFGFFKWKQHQAQIWQECVDAANVRAEAGDAFYVGKLHGVELSTRMIGITKINADRARVLKNMSFYNQPFQRFNKPVDFVSGLIVTNPPYGERLGDEDELKTTYAELGDWFKKDFKGYCAGVITSNEALGKSMGLKARKVNKFYNGALECLYLQFDIEDKYFVNRERLAQVKQTLDMAEYLADGGEDFKNRLSKNRKKFEKWAQLKNIECYRVYNSDLPEFNLAIDVYKDALVVQEFAAPKTIDPDKALVRMEKAMALIPLIYPEINSKQIYLKLRIRQKGAAQYEKVTDDKAYFKVQEGAALFWVNLSDYLDTGLFLDHRDVRLLIGRITQNKRFLNLFAYTGTASVHAAIGGATTTTTVDMSATYLTWADENFELNNLTTGTDHKLVQADVIKWLIDEVDFIEREPLMKQKESKYDVIFMDPPSFSNSKRMEGILDIQQDHMALIDHAMTLLDVEGVLIFSTNFRRFKLDAQILDSYNIENISLSTLPEDFARDPKIRQCYKIQEKK